MGLFNGILSGAADFVGSLVDRYRSPEIALVESGPQFDFANFPESSFGNPGGGIIVRDTGLGSRNLREALEVLSEAAPTLPGLSLFMDKYGFRSLTQNIRDLNESVRVNLLNRANTLSLINGMAHRALQIRTDLIVSEGFKIEADPDKDCPDEIRQRIQDVIDEHWEINDWQERTYERVLDLGRTGEMIRRVPALSTKIGGIKDFKLGRFTCGNIDPSLVYGISLDPWNYERLDRMYLEQYAFPNSNFKDLSLKVIADERLSLKEFGSIRGEVFYLAVNRRPGCSRGLTDLAPAMDWLDIYDQMLLMDVERANMMMRFIWDVTIENASPAFIKAYAESLKSNGPRPGTVRVHSHKEKWDAVSPDLKLSDSKELREDIFVYAWGSMGLPRPWFADGENANRASIENMTDPNFAWARTRRRSFTSYLELEHRYALQVAYDAGRFNDIPIEKLPEWMRLKVTARDPDRKGYADVGAVWTDVANSLTIMTNQGLLDKQTAADIVRTVLGTYGFEIDPERMKVVNAFDSGAQPGQPIDQNPQQTGGGMQSNGVTSGQNGVSSIAGSLPGGYGQVTESRRSALVGRTGMRKISPQHKGIMGSSDPLQAIMTEATQALRRSQAMNLKLKKHF